MEARPRWIPSKPSLSFKLLLPLVLPLLCLVGMGSALAESPETPGALGGPDNFGYTWQDGLTFAWIDASGSSPVQFENPSDGFVGPVDIGFAFKFYENTYSQVYISTNGMLSFGGGVTNINNQPVPKNVLPNNFIAPFWADLGVGGVYNDGAVYSQTVTAGEEHYFVVEWHGISMEGDQENLLTFEVILYDDGGGHQNGDVCFQYQSMSGVLDIATAGIEDADGSDGLQYLYNTPGFSNGQRVCFFRPEAQGRVKVLPDYQSRFVSGGGASFQVAVRNIGEAGADTFELTPILTATNWRLDLFQADGVTPLGDTNGNLITDTGQIAQDGTTTITVRLEPPTGTPPGDYAQVSLVAASAASGHNDRAFIQAARPVNFYQAMVDFMVGMRSLIAHDGQDVLRELTSYFSGISFSLEDTHNAQYIAAWDMKQATGGKFYSDIEYRLLAGLGAPIGPVHKLTQNATTPYKSLFDQHPTLAVTPGGKIGVTWLRNILNQQDAQNHNIYLAILDSSGSVLHGPLNVTQNSQWRYQDLEIPFYFNPRSAPAGTERIAVTWEENVVHQVVSTTELTNDIFYAIYGEDGSVKKAPTRLTTSVPGEMLYYTPCLVPLQGDLVLLAYSAYDPDVEDYAIYYTVLDETGAVLSGPHHLTGAHGANLTGEQFDNGAILLAWTDSTEGKISYAILDGTSYAKSYGPDWFNTPYGREANYVSTTIAGEGLGVLTWMDDDESDYLFYALVNDLGAQLTPPMIMYTGIGRDPMVLNSYVGQGIVPYNLSSIFLPLVRR